MNDVQELLRRQAEWQKKRMSLSFLEKLHMVEAIRESVLQLRQTGRRIKLRALQHRGGPADSDEGSTN